MHLVAILLSIALILIARPAIAGEDNRAENQFLLGVGGYEFCRQQGKLAPFGQHCAADAVISSELLPELLPNSNAVSLWVTRNWQPNWYKPEDIQQKLIGRGYTPVFLFYWFGDDISPQFVEQHQSAYFRDLQRFLDFLSKIDGEKWVILNPEFNQNGTQADADFNRLLIRSIRAVRQVKGARVSFCIGDFGDYSRITDPHNWRAFHPSIYRAVEEVDFISFQEMRAATRNPASHILNTADRALKFANYLHRRYQKPTFFAYLAISTIGEQGAEQQAQVYRRLGELLPQFRAEAGLIGFNSFHLMDVPDHQGYFNQGERFFGLIDRNGKAKPALNILRHLPVEAVPNENLN